MNFWPQICQYKKGYWRQPWCVRNNTFELVLELGKSPKNGLVFETLKFPNKECLIKRLSKNLRISKFTLYSRIWNLKYYQKNEFFETCKLPFQENKSKRLSIIS